MDRIHLSSPSNTYTPDSSDTPYNTDEREGGGERGKNSRFKTAVDVCMVVGSRFGQLSTEFEIFRELATAFPLRATRFRGG